MGVTLSWLQKLRNIDNAFRGWGLTTTSRFLGVSIAELFVQMLSIIGHHNIFTSILAIIGLHNFGVCLFTDLILLKFCTVNFLLTFPPTRSLISI